MSLGNRLGPVRPDFLCELPGDGQRVAWILPDWHSDALDVVLGGAHSTWFL
jgi:hypothetical protein